MTILIAIEDNDAVVRQFHLDSTCSERDMSPNPNHQGNNSTNPSEAEYNL